MPLDPTKTSKTLDAAKTVVLTGDALVTDVKAGKKFYKDDPATQLTGTLPTKAIIAGAETYEEGYHAGNVGGLSAIDADLAPANIKKDVNIFGVVGTYAPYDPLTVALFQANAAIGDAIDPENINDNNTTTMVRFTSAGKYCEIDFGDNYYVAEFRYFGNDAHDGSGQYKIQHWSGTEWIDNTTGIITRQETWSGWTSLTIPVITNRIRIIASTLDNVGYNYPFEFEMRG